MEERRQVFSSDTEKAREVLKLPPEAAIYTDGILQVTQHGLVKELVNNFDLNPMSLKNGFVSSAFHVNIKLIATQLQRNPPSPFQKSNDNMD